jgi:hypothetical protein
VPNSCPIRRRTPVNQSQPQLTFRRTQGKPPWSQDPPDTSSKLVIRQTLLGRSTSQLRETGHGGGLVSVFVSVAFVRLRSPTLRSDPVMRAGREHARTTGKPGWKACWTDSNVTATWLRRDRSAVNLSVQLAPSTDCHGLWDRPGPDLRIRRSVQQRSTATTAPSNTFGFIQMRPGQREKARSGDCAEFGTKC